MERGVDALADVPARVGEREREPPAVAVGAEADQVAAADGQAAVEGLLLQDVAEVRLPGACPPKP
jgi:hypothetical protein